MCAHIPRLLCREMRGPHMHSTYPYSPSKVGRLIIDLTSKTFLSSESIPAHLLNIKLALPHIVEHLTSVYNLCVQRIVFHKLSKTATVIPFPKQNADRSDPNNFRPFFFFLLLIFVLLKDTCTITCLFLWRNTTFFFTIFNLDLDQSTRVTLL